MVTLTTKQKAVIGTGVAAVAVGATYLYFKKKEKTEFSFVDPKYGLLYPTVPSFDLPTPLDMYVEVLAEVGDVFRIAEKLGTTENQQHAMIARTLMDRLDRKIKEKGMMLEIMRVLKEQTQQQQLVFKSICSFMVHFYRTATTSGIQESKIALPDFIKPPLMYLCKQHQQCATVNTWDLCLSTWQHKELAFGSHWEFEDCIGENLKHVHFAPTEIIRTPGERMFRSLFFVAEVYGMKIYPPMFAVYRLMAKDNIPGVCQRMDTITLWLKKLGLEIKGKWTKESIPAEDFMGMQRRMIVQDGEEMIGLSGFQLPLFQILNQFLAVAPPDELRKQMEDNAFEGIGPRYFKAYNYAMLRRGHLLAFLRKHKDAKLISSYNTLVKEVMAFRSMHRARASQYFEGSATSTSGQNRSDFNHEMDLIINATKDKLWLNELKKTNASGVRKSLLVNKDQKRGVSTLKAKPTDTHTIQKPRTTALF